MYNKLRFCDNLLFLKAVHFKPLRSSNPRLITTYENRKTGKIKIWTLAGTQGERKREREYVSERGGRPKFREHNSRINKRNRIKKVRAKSIRGGPAALAEEEADAATATTTY